VHHAPKTQYRSVEVASEPISSEAWREVPNGSVFSINGDLGLELIPLTSDSHQM
jgi:predicted glutamine amidotransferase